MYKRQLLHFDSVLVLVIVTKISLSVAKLFYALIYDIDDDDYAGLSSGVERIRSRRHMSGVKRHKKFLSCPSIFWLYNYNQSFW